MASCTHCGTKMGFFHAAKFCKACQGGVDGLVAAVEVALDDEVLTQAEEDRLDKTVADAGFAWGDVGRAKPELLDELLIAKTNDGRLETMKLPRLLVQTGEVVHIESPASIISEQVLREWKGGARGVSVPLGHGVRYRTSGIRGHSVVTGTQMVASDTGVLSVSSQRVVFMGNKSTIEMQLKKLVDVKAFSDGLQLHVSNRKAAPVFRTTVSGQALAAVISAATKKVMA